MNLPEIILRIPGSADYYVSDRGDVYRILKNGTFKKLKPWLEDRKRRGISYFRVAIRKDGVFRKFYVHHLVCLTFKGQAPEGKRLVCHGPGGHLDNSVQNLRWGSFQENNGIDRKSGSDYSEEAYLERWSDFYEQKSVVDLFIEQNEFQNEKNDVDLPF